MLRRSLVLLVVACARPPEAAPIPVRDATNLQDTPAATVLSSRPDPCLLRGSEDEGLTIMAPPDGMPFEWDVACAGSGFVLGLRTGTKLRVARRALFPNAPWTPPEWIADDVSSLGRAGQVGAHVWVPWVSTRRGLRIVRVADGLRMAEPAMPPPFGVYAQPFVLGGVEDAALVLMRQRSRRSDRLVVMRVGFDRRPVGAELTRGEVQVVRSGDEPVALVLAREASPQGEVNVLRAWRFDLATALTLTGGAAPDPFATLPEGTARVGPPLGVGRGRFELSPFAPGVDALLLQTVLGAERGPVRVAWFPPAGAPEALYLPFAAQALGAAVAEGTHTVRITWWDEHNALRQAHVTRDGLRDAGRIGAPESSARAAQQLARDTRVVWCGATAWTVQARREGATVRFRSWPVGCMCDETSL